MRRRQHGRAGHPDPSAQWWLDLELVDGRLRRPEDSVEEDSLTSEQP